jgi:hypothetical protein
VYDDGTPMTNDGDINEKLGELADVVIMHMFGEQRSRLQESWKDPRVLGETFTEIMRSYAEEGLDLGNGPRRTALKDLVSPAKPRPKRTGHVATPPPPVFAEGTPPRPTPEPLTPCPRDLARESTADLLANVDEMLEQDMSGAGEEEPSEPSETEEESAVKEESEEESVEESEPLPPPPPSRKRKANANTGPQPPRKKTVKEKAAGKAAGKGAAGKAVKGKAAAGKGAVETGAVETGAAGKGAAGKGAAGKGGRKRKSDNDDDEDFRPAAGRRRKR